VNENPPEFILFLGRFHPLLVHLPIGFIVLLAALEALALFPRCRQANCSSGVILVLAVPASLFSALCGWLLSRAGGYEPTLLERHMWTGFAVAAACVVTSLLHWREHRRAYRVSLLGTCVALAVASHFGGSLTHGTDYLTRHAPAPIKALLGAKATAPAQASSGTAAANDAVFAAAVRPVLDKYCQTCHGPEKAKGELRLHTLEGLLQGGESGPVVVPFKSGESPLVRRMGLPADHEDHMPPEGKPQPSPEEVALIRWWVDAGAPTNKPARELSPPPHLQRLLSQATAQPGAPQAAAAPDLAPLARTQALALAEPLAEELDISVTALSQDEPWLQANASLASTNFGDAELARLAPLGANLRWLDLAGTRVTDAGLAHLAGMTNLTRLHLERTGIGDAGLGQLTGLAGLSYLNLYGTAVTDAGLAQLQPLRQLRQLYLWQTRVTPEGARLFGEAVADKAQMQRWADEIEMLRGKIRNQALLVETGLPLTVAAPTNTTAMNTNCPVSGKAVDPSKTALYEGRKVAFCCDNCLSTFQKDPKPYLAKLGLTRKGTEQETGKSSP
jgi:uncharacterized membrane protein/YHS domain-containing protein